MKNLYKNPFIVLFISLLIILLGIKQFFSLPIALYPETSKPVIKTSIVFVNMGSEEFKENYGKKIEASLNSLEKVNFIESHYFKGSARWEISFDWGTDEKKAKVDVEAILAQISATLPKMWPKFFTYYNSSKSADIYASVSSEKYSEQELYELLNNKVLHSLEAIEGIESPTFYKFYEEYIRIELKPSLLEARGLHPRQIRDALLKKEFNKNLGSYKAKNNSYNIVIPLKDKTIDDLKDTLIPLEKSYNYRLDDFADIYLTTKKYDFNLKANGKKALIAHASVKPTGNISFVSKEFIKKLKKLASAIDPQIKINVLTDPSQFIEEAISNILLSILLGVMIATLVIFLFLPSFQHTLIIAISIPLSLLGGFILMDLLNIEINLISLGAMALAVGMVVDGSIVVLENISRHLKENPPKNYKEKVTTVIFGVSEVKSAVFSSLLTTIIVFVPLSFTAPLANAILGDLARVMVCVLVISVAVTLYIIPPLLLLLKEKGDEKQKKGVYFCSYKFSEFIYWVQKIYLKTLSSLMTSSKKSFSLFAFIFAALLCSLWILTTKIKKEIIATPDSDKVFLHFNFLEGELPIEKANKIVTEQIEMIIAEEYNSYLDNYLTQTYKTNGNVLCSLKDKSMLKEFKASLEKRFKNSPRVSFYVQAWNPTALEIPKEALLNIKIDGKNTQEKRKNLKKLQENLSKNKEMGQLKMWPYPNKTRSYELKMDKTKVLMIEKNGNPNFGNDMANLLTYYTSKTFVKNLSINSNRYPVYITYPEDSLEKIDDIKNIIVKIKEDYYPLRNFLYPQLKEEDNDFYHENGKEIFRAKFFEKHSFEGDREDLKAKVIKNLKEDKKVDFKNYTFDETGKEINESLFSLLNSLALALFLIVLVLTLQFGSFKQTFVIMLAIPLGIIGVSFSLYLFSSTLSVNSMLGIILLSGTAVNNSIIFVDFFNKIYQDPTRNNLRESLLKTANLRLRPILITTLTTILGMAPIAFAYGSGGEVLQPLGISICGGLGLSTFLTLYIIPLVLYKIEVKKCV